MHEKYFCLLILITDNNLLMADTYDLIKLRF